MRKLSTTLSFSSVVSSLAKKIFRIEFVFIYIALINLCYTIYLKSAAAKKYIKLDSQMTLLLSECGTYSVETAQNDSALSADSDELLQKFDVLYAKYFPYVYFDKTLDNSFMHIQDAIRNHLDFRTISNFVNDFQTQMYNTRIRLNFGYDSMIITSLILFFISGFVFFFKKTIHDNERKNKEIVMEEQTKIRQDLHDGLAQDLATLNIFLEKKDLEKTQFYATQALSEVRYILNSMNSDFEKNASSIDYENFLVKSLEVFELHFGIKTQFFSSCNISNLPNDIKMNLWRIMQETLSNIARHSNATKVEIKFLSIGKELKFIIEDNGIGFEIEKVENAKTGHYGLENIKNRVQKMNATVQFINKNEEGGSTLAITIKDFIY